MVTRRDDDLKGILGRIHINLLKKIIMRRFEYRAINISSFKIKPECDFIEFCESMEALNILGEEGWEVCGVMSNDVVLLKKEK